MRAIAMQSLQLHLTGAARSWLSWGELESQFTRNFRSTYKCPALIEEVKTCVQRKGETLRSYIQRWSIIGNSAEDISDERAVDAFSAGLRCLDLVEELGRTKLRIVSELMEVCRGDDFRGRPRVVLSTGWRPRNLHGAKSGRPASSKGPAAVAAGW
jgi:hypothetical protein